MAVQGCWYPDPDGGAGERWWNGAGWSESRRGGVAAAPVVAPVPVVVPPPATAPVIYSASNPAPQSPGQYSTATSLRSVTSVNTKVNPQAIYAFMTGIVAVFFNFLLVPGILAIVFAVRGLKRASQLQAEGQTNTLRTFAIIGLVMGIFGTITGIVQVAVVVVGILSSITVDITS
jgi:hypothetical protein